MDGYRHDTSRLGRRNRFRPASRHETTGRRANSSDGRAGWRDGTIKLVIVRCPRRQAGMDNRKRSSGRSCVTRRQASMAERKTIRYMIVRLVWREAGREEGRAGETHIYDVIYGIGDTMKHPPPGETHIEGERFRCATMISTIRVSMTSLAIQSTHRRLMSI